MAFLGAVRACVQDDYAVWTRGRHTLKLGVHSLGYFVHDFNPNTFNGTFIFGGGSAPVLSRDWDRFHTDNSIGEK